MLNKVSLVINHVSSMPKKLTLNCFKCMIGLQVHAFILELGMATNKYKISSWKIYLFSGFKQPEHGILEENHDKISSSHNVTETDRRWKELDQ